MIFPLASEQATITLVRGINTGGLGTASPARRHCAAGVASGGNCRWWRHGSPNAFAGMHRRRMPGARQDDMAPAGVIVQRHDRACPDRSLAEEFGNHLQRRFTSASATNCVRR